jgi:hypothetical protein
MLRRDRAKAETAAEYMTAIEQVVSVSPPTSTTAPKIDEISILFAMVEANSANGTDSAEYPDVPTIDAASAVVVGRAAASLGIASRTTVSGILSMIASSRFSSGVS